MVAETMFTQIIHEASPASKGNPSLLPVCCVCGLVQDKTGRSHDHMRWATRRTCQETHGAIPADSVLTHTYRPNCFTRFMDRMRTG